MIRKTCLLALVAGLTACGDAPETPATPGEARVTAKAVADVEAAMAEARRAPVVPPAPPPPVTAPAP